MTNEEDQQRQEAARYVIDSIFGGKIPFADVLGNAPNNNAAQEEESGEQVWPYVPTEWGPTPPDLAEVVKQVKYIADILYMTLSPRPLPTDDMAMLSDMLLSLETRSDITGRVLLDSGAPHRVKQVADCGEWPQGDEHDFVQRAKQLVKYWEKEKHAAWEANRTTPGPSPDFPITPLRTLPCDGRNASWKFCFSAEQGEDAQNVFMAHQTERIDSAAFFKENRPRPMGWAPLKGTDAWEATNRSKIESGDLYGSKLWKPLWGEYGFLVTRHKWGWQNPNDEERAEYERFKAFGDAWKTKIREMRQR